MNDTHSPTEKKREIHPLLLALVLAISFVFWGMFIYLKVGDQWPPVWDFGAVADVPGLSAYSTASPRPGPALIPPSLHEGAQTAPQHVMEPPLSSNKKEAAP